MKLTNKNNKNEIEKKYEMLLKSRGGFIVLSNDSIDINYFNLSQKNVNSMKNTFTYFNQINQGM